MLHKTKAEANEEYDQIWLTDPNKRLGIFPVTRWDIPKHRPAELLGYQVVEIKRVGWWGKASTKPLLAPSRPSHEGVETPTVTVTAQSVPRDETAVARFPFYQETPAYIGVIANDRVSWFGKGTLLSVTMLGDNEVVLTIAKKPLVKRGMERYIVA